jgi:hypothetical protein
MQGISTLGQRASSLCIDDRASFVFNLRSRFITASGKQWGAKRSFRNYFGLKLRWCGTCYKRTLAGYSQFSTRNVLLAAGP